MKRLCGCASLLVLLLATVRPVFAAKDVPVPAACTPTVNEGLANLIASHTTQDVDNIMACGIATAPTQYRPGGPHGGHHITTISVQLPAGASVNVQIVTNDALDGIVTAKANDPVFAYGQGYNTHGQWVAGIHDVHCSTHVGADNGWVVVAGVKTPKSCPSQ